MKNVGKIVVSTLLVLTASGAWRQAAAVCSNHTLHGDYAFRVSGEVFTPGDIVNRDGIAMTQFDGNGNLTQVDWVVANGAPVLETHPGTRVFEPKISVT